MWVLMEINLSKTSLEMKCPGCVGVNWIEIRFPGCVGVNWIEMKSPGCVGVRGFQVG